MNIITESTSKKMWISFEYKDVTYYYRFKYGRSYSNVEKYFKHNKNQFSIVTAGDFRIISKRIDKMNKRNRDIIYTSGWIITKLDPASDEYKKKIKSIKSSIKKKKSVEKDSDTKVDQKIEKDKIKDDKVDSNDVVDFGGEINKFKKINYIESTAEGDKLTVEYSFKESNKLYKTIFKSMDFEDDETEEGYMITTRLIPYNNEQNKNYWKSIAGLNYKEAGDDAKKGIFKSFSDDGTPYTFHKNFIDHLEEGIKYLSDTGGNIDKWSGLNGQIEEIQGYFDQLINIEVEESGEEGTDSESEEVTGKKETEREKRAKKSQIRQVKVDYDIDYFRKVIKGAETDDNITFGEIDFDENN